MAVVCQDIVTLENKERCSDDLVEIKFPLLLKSLARIYKLIIKDLSATMGEVTIIIFRSSWTIYVVM